MTTRPDLILQAGLPLRSGLIVVLYGHCCGHFYLAPKRTFELLRHTYEAAADGIDHDNLLALLFHRVVIGVSFVHNLWAMEASMVRLIFHTGFVVALMWASSSAAAEPVDTARSVIGRQIEAFLEDDAAAAYSFASPEIRGLFPNQDVFFDMVKRGYNPVYRPGNFAFGRSKVDGTTVVQEVLISGPDGKDWTALYSLKLQPDGTYKINGVQMLQQTPGPQI